jgi:hypothetical protein
MRNEPVAALPILVLRQLGQRINQRFYRGIQLRLMPPRRTRKEDSPPKLAGRMKRRGRVIMLRNEG